MIEARVAALDRLEKRLTLPLVLGFLALATFFIAWNRGIALFYALAFLLLAVLLVGSLFARLNLGGLVAERIWPAEATVGEPVALVVGCSLRPESRLGRLWPFARRWIEAAETLPWVESGVGRALLPRVVARTAASASIQVTPLLRGEHRAGDLRLASLWPLGFARHEAMPAVDGQSILVYPRVVPMRHFPEPRHGAMPQPTQGVVCRRAGHEEFREIDNYRPGDSIRHVAWRATAQHGQLLVRRFDDTSEPRIMVLLDAHRAVHAGEGARASFEVAVTLAASMIHAGLRAGRAVGLAAYGDRFVWLAPARGETQWLRLRDALARVAADGAMPYREAVPRAHAALGEGADWVYFHHPDDLVAPPPWPRALRVFAFDRAGFLPAATAGESASRPAPTTARWIRADTDLAALLDGPVA